MVRIARICLVAVGCSAASLSGCRSKATVEDEAPASSAVATSSARPAAAPLPPAPTALPSAQVQAVVNPNNAPPYSGPRGTVRGVVRATGAPSPPLGDKVAAIPANRCPQAHAMYEKLFREGPDRGLADVLVAVTGYSGMVPAKGPAVDVAARGCAFDRRTIALTYGQTIRVTNKDANTYMPQLLGQSSPAVLVAMPGGEPLDLLPARIGQYALQDASHPFATADVFVVRYATTDVTGLDGAFSIDRVPAGEVKVSAYLPVTAQTVEKTVVVPDGGSADVDFTIEVEPSRRDELPARADSVSPLAAPSAR